MSEPTDEDYRARYEQLSAIYRLTQALVAARSTEQIYDDALECLFATTHAHRASVLLFDPDGVMRFKAWRGLSDSYRAAVEGHSPWSRETRSPEPVVVPDVAREPTLASLRDVIEAERIRSLAFVPLVYGNELLGKFMLYRDEPHEFSKEEISVAATIAGHIAVAVDRRRTEERLQLYREIFANSNDGIAVIRSDGKYVEQNASHRKLLDYDDVTITGHTPAIHLGDDTFAEIASALVRDGVFRGEVRSSKRDGTPVVIDLSAFAVRDGDGNPVCFVGIKRDVTARRQVESERAIALDVAERANRVKDEFLGTVSHELRTPLNAIFGWNHMLRTGALDAAGTLRAIDAIERNARAQARLVDDLLDVARIDAHKLSIETRPTELGSVIEPAMESLRPAADAKRIALSCEMAPAVGMVAADHARLQQVIGNVLSNAVKFTPPGGRVAVVVDREGDTVRIRVTDTGQGIAPEFLGHVFERFRQADSSSTRRHAGLGLGLSIVRQLVHLHGGEVFAESEGVGRGATFTITLPALASIVSSLPATGHDAAAVPARSLRGLRVMVVDDEEDARQLLDALLSRSGAEVRLHAGVDAALDDLTGWNADVIVSDIGMPDRDGYALVRSLRARADERRDIPVIALSAYARSDDRDRSLASGFQAHLTKPVDPDELTRTLVAMAQRAK